MAFRNTDKIDLLDSVMRFYRQRLNLPDNGVFPVGHALGPPAFPAGGPFYVGIAVGDGRFTLEEQDDEQLREDCTFIAMAYTRMQRDWGDRFDNFLRDRKQGALALQSKLLLIVGSDLTDEDGISLLASRPYAIDTVAPNYDKDKAVGWTGIRFGLEFDWDIVEAEDLGDD